MELKEILCDEQQVCSEEGETYHMAYYLLVEEVKVGDHMFCENYGVKISISGRGKRESLAMPGLTPSAQRATALLDRLSRNFVTPVTLPDIIEDWLE